MSDEKYCQCIFIYLGSSMGVARKKSFKSQLRNLAPFFASEITLCSSIVVSRRLAVGDPTSDVYSNLFSPTTSLTPHFFCF